MPFTRHAALILVPVLLLAGIAVFGLVEYRHAITAEAREVATRWTEQSEPLFAHLEAAVEALPQTILYDDLPQAAGAASPAVDRLEKATAAGDAVALRGLVDSPGRTASGLPVRVLAAWRLLDLGGGISDAERLAGLAIHEAPSAISAPVVQALLERFPDPSGRTDWAGEWQSSEARRAVLASDPGASGFVGTPDGPALLLGGKVLTAPELRSTATALVADQRTFLPEWMTLDLVARDTSLVFPIGDPFVAGGSPLRVDVGIGDPQALYARYWRLFWWAAALIACALGTAVTGIVLAARSLARERRLGELKSQFVASVSHELRTPVASIRLMADALDGGKVDGDTAMNFHRLMSQEGARLSSLIENVLDFARIEEGRKDYAFAETDLGALVRDTIGLVAPVAGEREVAIDCQIEDPDGSRAPVLDSVAIQQALVN
ncbi:MAG: sensor histidine kinase, partial [Verrucomicrobiales bacterium]